MMGVLQLLCLWLVPHYFERWLYNIKPPNRRVNRAIYINIIMRIIRLKKNNVIYCFKPSRLARVKWRAIRSITLVYLQQIHSMFLCTCRPSIRPISNLWIEKASSRCVTIFIVILTKIENYEFLHRDFNWNTLISDEGTQNTSNVCWPVCMQSNAVMYNVCMCMFRVRPYVVRVNMYWLRLEYDNFVC